jgi:hypothetical protein
MATRRPLTDRQREIRSTERAHTRMQAVATEQAAVREQQHGAQRQATEAALRSDRQAALPSRKRRFANALGDEAISRGSSAVVSTATPSSNSGLIMTTIFLIFGLIAFYLIVTTAQGANTFMTTLSNALASISQNKPLFTSK